MGKPEIKREIRDYVNKSGEAKEFTRYYVAVDGWEFDLERPSENDKKILDGIIANSDKAVAKQ